MILKIEELQEYFAMVIDKLYSINLTNIEIDIDLYKFIDASDWDAFDEEDKLPLIGSLTDDLTSLKRTIENDALFTYVDFDRLASVLHAISYLQNPPIDDE